LNLYHLTSAPSIAEEIIVKVSLERKRGSKNGLGMPNRHPTHSWGL
jgi:hypothetical protein